MEAYRTIDTMKMVAVCDVMPERVQAFRDDFGVAEGYTDFAEALAKVKPDVVHVGTQPGTRIWEAETCAAGGVKVMVVEKPMAIKPSELAALTRVHEETGMEIIQNCQRRYYPQFRDGLIHQIANEKIGDLYFVRASTRGNTIAMGPHMMDLLQLFLGEAQPTAVWAMAHTIVEDDAYQHTHKAPESLMAQYWFDVQGREVRVIFDCAPDALGTPGEEGFWMHLHFDFLGTAGRLFLTREQRLLVAGRGNGRAGARGQQLGRAGVRRTARLHPRRGPVAGRGRAASEPLRRQPGGHRGPAGCAEVGLRGRQDQPADGVHG